MPGDRAHGQAQPRDARRRVILDPFQKVLVQLLLEFLLVRGTAQFVEFPPIFVVQRVAFPLERGAGQVQKVPEIKLGVHVLHQRPRQRQAETAVFARKTLRHVRLPVQRVQGTRVQHSGFAARVVAHDDGAGARVVEHPSHELGRAHVMEHVVVLAARNIFAVSGFAAHPRVIAVVCAIKPRGGAGGTRGARGGGGGGRGGGRGGRGRGRGRGNAPVVADELHALLVHHAAGQIRRPVAVVERVLDGFLHYGRALHVDFLEEGCDLFRCERARFVVDLVFLRHVACQPSFFEHVEEKGPRNLVHDDAGVVHVDFLLRQHGAAREIERLGRGTFANDRQLGANLGVFRVREQKCRAQGVLLVVLVVLLVVHAGLGGGVGLPWLLEQVVVVVVVVDVVVCHGGQAVSVVLRFEGVRAVAQTGLLHKIPLFAPVVVAFEFPAESFLGAEFLQSLRHFAAVRRLGHFERGDKVGGQIVAPFLAGGAVCVHGGLLRLVHVLAQHQRAVQHVHFLELKIDAEITLGGVAVNFGAGAHGADEHGHDLVEIGQGEGHAHGVEEGDDRGLDGKGPAPFDEVLTEAARVLFAFDALRLQKPRDRVEEMMHRAHIHFRANGGKKLLHLHAAHHVIPRTGLGLLHLLFVLRGLRVQPRRLVGAGGCFVPAGVAGACGVALVVEKVLLVTAAEDHEPVLQRFLVVGVAGGVGVFVQVDHPGAVAAVGFVVLGVLLPAVGADPRDRAFALDDAARNPRFVDRCRDTGNTREKREGV